MKNCEYCSYFKTMENGSASDNRNRAICLFTDTMIFTDQDNTGLEYPCRNTDYQGYLQKRTTHVSISMLKEDNWRLVYKIRHRVSEKNRVIVSARAIV